jgi:SNF2 family DNA or RNA helicase
MAPVLNIDYDSTDRRAVLACPTEQADSEWFTLLKRALGDYTSAVVSTSPNVIAVPWWLLLGSRIAVQEIRSTYGVDIRPSAEASRHLQAAALRRVGYEQAARATPVSEEAMYASLSAAGFQRQLTPEQIRNVTKLAALPSAATFSVPGAGKTTEALAYYAVRATAGEPLLVVAPKNAFGAWDEQLAECFGWKAGAFVRLRGGQDRIEQQLRGTPRFMIITYQQLARVGELIAALVGSRDTFVFLDESHRIKGGRGRATADAILTISHLPAGKLVMSGTPMPQAFDDLVPQFSFLYPEVFVSPDRVVDLVRPIYVRTTKAQLHLPPVTRVTIPVDMRPAQRKLYDLMKYEVARQAETTLSIRSRQAFRAMGRSGFRLREVVSNPYLLASEIGFAHQELLASVLAEGDAPKIEYACTRARQLAASGNKVLIWTSFRENVEMIAARLADLKAVYIHGGVDAGEEDDSDTREGRIRTFHDDRACLAMVANPAAAAEGISLHKVCHNAIYVDRAYNAAHYLQSEDRIHRLGLKPADTTTIEIVECTRSIDQSVGTRLSSKVQRMADALDDTSLNIDPIPIDAYIADDAAADDGHGLDIDDVKSILESINAGS